MSVGRSARSAQQVDFDAFAIPALVACLVGCTFVSDFDVHQCSSDSECADLPEPAVCASSRCVRGCATNRQCTEFDPRSPICAYPGGGCLALTTEGGECFAASAHDERAVADVTGRDMMFIGAFDSANTTSTWLSLQLAAAELNAAGGLPRGGRFQPVVVVLCDPRHESEAMVHLVDRLQVSGVVATLEDAVLRAALAAQVEHPVFFLSPNGSNTRPSTLADSGQRLFYLGPEYADLVDAYGVLLDRFRGSIAARRPESPLPRIASIRGPAAEDQALAARVVERLARAGLDTSGSDRIASPYRSFELFGESSLDPDAQLQELVAYGPDLVLFMAGGTYAGAPFGSFDDPRRQRTAVLRTIQAQAMATPGFQPLFVLGPRNVDDSAPRRLAFDSPQFASHAVLLQGYHEPDAALAAGVRERFESAYPIAITPAIGEGPAFGVYDALYALVYSIAAAPPDTAPADAAAVAAGLARVTDTSAERVDVGPMGLDAAKALLDAGSAFHLHGSTGSLDLDAIQQARPGTSRLSCWDAVSELSTLATYDTQSADFVRVPGACAALGSELLGE
jgi:hypothetical protein